MVGSPDERAEVLLATLEDIDDANAAGAAHVVGQAKFQIGVGQLTVAALAAQLLEYLNYLCNAAGAHRMALGFQPAAVVDGPVLMGRSPVRAVRPSSTA